VKVGKVKQSVNPTNLAVTGFAIALVWISYAFGRLPLVTPAFVTIVVPVMFVVFYKKSLPGRSTSERNRRRSTWTPRKQSLALFAMAGGCLVVAVILEVIK
jgi:hypothetical protein